jgi:hypothetical protein
VNLALWIGIPVLLVLVAAWRLRRAARALRHILADEPEPTEPPETDTPAHEAQCS